MKKGTMSVKFTTMYAGPGTQRGLSRWTKEKKGRREKERKGVEEAMGHSCIFSSIAKPTCMGRFDRH